MRLNNYKYSIISGEYIRYKWKSKLLNNWTDGCDLLAIYIENPFCIRKCNYCCFFRAEFNKDLHHNYFKKYLPKLIDFYKDILHIRKADLCYVGGGTGNLASISILRKLFKKIPYFKDIPLKKFEGHPNLFTKRKIDLLKEFNFTDISIGVQTLDFRILESQNRLLPNPKKLKQIINYAIANDMKVNCDLLAYIECGDLQGLSILKKDLELLAEYYRPSYITIYPLYQQFDYHRNPKILFEKDIYINKIIELQKTIADFMDRSPYSVSFDNLVEYDRENIWKSLITCYTISKRTMANTEKSFLYDCSIGNCSNYQSVIGFGGLRDCPTLSYIYDDIRYITNNIESDIKFFVLDN